MTNSEFVEYVFDFAPTSGATAQLFALEAIRKEANKIIEMDFEDLEKAFGPSPFISPEIWLAAANDWKEAMENRKK